MRVPLSRHHVFWPLALGGFLVDQVSKGIVFAQVGDPSTGRDGSVNVIRGFFQLRTSLNPGGLWGLGGGYGWLFCVLSFLAAGFIIYLLFIRPGERDHWMVTALGLIQGGVLGNLLDRLRFNGVRDFLDFYVFGYHYPTFNVADALLVVGALMLILQTLFVAPRPATEADTDAS
ncbi:signal peptidase II [bacterium]|nr:signal peptidase II [bacterium]